MEGLVRTYVRFFKDNLRIGKKGFGKNFDKILQTSFKILQTKILQDLRPDLSKIVHDLTKKIQKFSSKDLA